MKSVKPDDLLIHRVFFTEFDKYNSIFLWENSKDEIYKLLERKLKLLILTKGHVVIAASQLLESPFAHNLLLKHPELLESGAIVSSMKYGHYSTSDFLFYKREEQKNNKNNPYHTVLAKEVANIIDDKGVVVRWSIEGISNWFRDRLVKDLKDENSLLRITLKKQNVILPNNIAENIKRTSHLSRGKVEQIVSKYNNPTLENIIIAYADFIYYLSGARTTVKS